MSPQSYHSPRPPSQAGLTSPPRRLVLEIEAHPQSVRQSIVALVHAGPTCPPSTVSSTVGCCTRSRATNSTTIGCLFSKLRHISICLSVRCCTGSRCEMPSMAVRHDNDFGISSISLSTLLICRMDTTISCPVRHIKEDAILLTAAHRAANSAPTSSSVLVIGGFTPGTSVPFETIADCVFPRGSRHLFSSQNGNGGRRRGALTGELRLRRRQASVYKTDRLPGSAMAVGVGPGLLLVTTRDVNFKGLDVCTRPRLWEVCVLLEDGLWAHGGVRSATVVTDTPCAVDQPLLQWHDESRVGSLVGQAVV